MFLPVIYESKKYWIPENLKKGALHRALGIPEDQKIPLKKLLEVKKRLQNKKGKLSEAERRLLKRVVLALTFRKFNR